MIITFADVKTDREKIRTEKKIFRDKNVKTRHARSPLNVREKLAKDSRTKWRGRGTQATIPEWPTRANWRGVAEFPTARRCRRRLSIFVDGCRPSRAQQSRRRRRRRRRAVPYRRGREAMYRYRWRWPRIYVDVGKTRAIIGRDCAYRGSGPVIVVVEKNFFVYIGVTASANLPGHCVYVVRYIIRRGTTR